MKKLFSSIIFLALAVSCVAPRDKKALYKDPFSGSATDSASYTDSSGSTAGGMVEVDNTGTTSGSGGSNIPSYISHCQWSYDGNTGYTAASNGHLGPHTICQSRDNESDIYVQVANPSNSARICVVPTYEASGKSIFLGEARCQFIDSSTKIYKFPLVKNRDYGRYQNFPINSVMVMKEQTYFFDSPYYRDQISYDAYFICAINMDLHNDSSYCDTFKAKGEYVYKRF
jgi:hypothetical protein